MKRILHVAVLIAHFKGGFLSFGVMELIRHSLDNISLSIGVIKFIYCLQYSTLLCLWDRQIYEG